MIASVPASAAPITFQSWEVASEFNDTTNPAGVWSYGVQSTLPGTFTPITVVDSSPPIVGWQGTTTPTDGPYIVHNTTNTTQGPFGSEFIVFPPHAMSLHPSVSCDYAVARFTVPKKGKYRISGQFYAIDYNAGTTTDVHVSVNGVDKFPGHFIDFPTGVDSASFSAINTVTLAKNSTIDFQVGCGSNGNYFSDTTGLNAVIELK